MLHGTGIFTDISHKFMMNVGKYSIHGASGIGKKTSSFMVLNVFQPVVIRDHSFSFLGESASWMV